MEYKYKFSYGNIFKFIFSEIMLIICNLISLIIIFMTIAFLYGWFEYIFSENYAIKKISALISIILIVSYSLFLIIIFFLPKKAVIAGKFLKIKRYMLNFNYILRGFNDEIFIKDIVECKKYDGKRYRFDRRDPYAVLFFNWDDLVEIRTNDDKKYLVPIKNSDDFIEKVNEIRRSFQEDKAGDNTLC